MVAMNSSFDNPTCANNGLRREMFKGWKTGYLFGSGGRAVGRGGCAPKGAGMYRSSAFWKTKLEDSQIPTGFGFGERKGFNDDRPWKLDPCTYGDVNPLVALTRTDLRRDVTLKGRFDRPDKKSTTPGPKYDVSAKPGDVGPNWSINGRRRGNMSITPGPGQYETRSKPGRNYPIAYGTLYDVVLQGRTKMPDFKMKMPGPGQYNPGSFTDKYNVAPIPPPHKKSTSADVPEGGLAGLTMDMLGEGNSQGVYKRVGASTILLAEMTEHLPGAAMAGSNSAPVLLPGQVA